MTAVQTQSQLTAEANGRRRLARSGAPGEHHAYDVRPIQTHPEEWQAVSDLFGIVWPGMRHLTPDYLHWQYAENPRGPVIGFNAWAGQTLAAHYALIPIRAMVHGVAVDAALSLNTAVHPAHQRRGLFTTLAERTYELASERDVDHVVGVGNAMSTHRFVNRLGFELIAPLDVHLLWRSPRRENTGGATPLWKRIWTEDDLAWRLRNPSIPYRLSRSGGCLHVLAPTHMRGIRAILKIERPGEAGTRELARLRPLRRPFVRLWMGRGVEIEIPAGAGLRVPDRFKPSPLNLIMRRLRSDRERIDPARVAFEAIDFDAY